MHEPQLLFRSPYQPVAPSPVGHLGPWQMGRALEVLPEQPVQPFPGHQPLQLLLEPPMQQPLPHVLAVALEQHRRPEIQPK